MLFSIFLSLFLLFVSLSLFALLIKLDQPSVPPAKKKEQSIEN